MRKVVVGIVILCLYVNASSIYYPQKLNTISLKNPEIIAAHSENDFWIIEEKGFLIHFTSGEWKYYPIPHRKNLTGFRAVQVSKNLFLVTGYDENWKTSIFWFKNYQWIQDTLRIDKPIKQIIKVRHDLIYISGDWSAFYRFNGKRWMKISLPFNALFWVYFFSQNEMYLATRGQGLYKFDGRNVEKLFFQADPGEAIVRATKDSTGKVFFLSNAGNVYVSEGNRFIRSNQTFPDSIQYSFQSIQWKDIRIPNLFRVRQIFPLSSRNALFVSYGGDIYLIQPIEKNYFINGADRYNLGRTGSMFLSGASFLDLNQDQYPDLLLLTKYDYGNWTFLLNEAGKPFVNVTHQTGFRAESGDYLAVPIELNGDHLIDLAILSRTPVGNALKLFVQKKELRYVMFDSISFEGPLFNKYPFKSMYKGDFDGNGLMDVGISTYYNKNFRRGHQIWFLNHVQGLNLKRVLLDDALRGYTINGIWADFNNDGTNDCLFINQWDSLKILFARNDEESFNIKAIPLNPNEAPLGALVFDYDNDGDLDIVLSSDQHTIYFLTNKGDGTFDQSLQPGGLVEINQHLYPFQIFRFMTNIDVNNDGYEDILFCLRDPNNPRNYLFINHQGKFFTEEASGYRIDQPVLYAAITGDIDRDGDMDIFGYNGDENFLYLNNQQSKNFLEVFVKGTISNSEGMGTKLWIYQSGHMEDSAALIAYRQLINNQFSPNHSNQPFFLVGLPDTGYYDVKIQYYNGKTRYMPKVKAGSILSVSELDSRIADLYKIPGNIIRFFSYTDNQIYVVLTILVGILVFFSVKAGTRYFLWENSTSLLFGIYNLTLYWIFLFTNMNNISPIKKYVIPVVIVIANMVFIIAYSIISRIQRFGEKDTEKSEEALLKHLLFFSHGETGSKNLISLQLLLNNPPESPDKWNEYQRMLIQRLRLFKEYNIPIIKKIDHILTTIGSHSNLHKELKEKIRIFKDLNEDTILRDKDGIKNEINRLYSIIRELKQEIFRKFTCDPKEVILQLINVRSQGTHISLFKNYSGKLNVFIKKEDLIFVLDNLIQNASKAISDKKDGMIKIMVIKKFPGVDIEVHDNGRGIPDEIKKVLFSKEISNIKGKGMGLYQSRHLLEKYQGKIYLDHSYEGETVFKIELREME